MNMMDTPCHLEPICVQEYSGSRWKIKQTEGNSSSKAAYRHTCMSREIVKTKQRDGGKVCATFQRIWFRIAFTVTWLPHWSYWMPSKIGQICWFGQNCAHLLINQSPRLYEHFIGATPDITLAIQLKRVSIVVLYGSENTKWLTS